MLATWLRNGGSPPEHARSVHRTTGGNKLSEKQIQNAILRVFGTRPDIRLWRANAGVARYGRRVVAFGIPGQADLTGILPDGVRLEIEVKGPDSRQTKEQRSFQRMIERFGGVYVLARSAPDVWQAIGSYLRDHG